VEAEGLTQLSWAVLCNISGLINAWIGIFKLTENSLFLYQYWR